MARPRTPIGTYGTISIRRQPSGRYAARTRYRDWDGKSREVQYTASTRPAAERALKKKLAEYEKTEPGHGDGGRSEVPGANGKPVAGRAKSAEDIINEMPAIG